MKTNRFKLSDVGIGVLFTLFFISFGVVFILNFRAFYSLEIDWLAIDKTSGLSKETILLNYNALMDYLSPLHTGDLVFPTLAASESGLFHFVEVKDIFILFYRIFAFSLIGVIAVVIYKKKRQDFSYLFVSSLTCIILPIVVGAACMINFDKAFVLFHNLFFDNDYWIFDPITDPVITILPQEFFLHCALLIVGIVVLGSVSLFLFSKSYKDSKN